MTVTVLDYRTHPTTTKYKVTKRNPAKGPYLGVTFVLAFIILLVVAIGLLAEGDNSVANRFGGYAFLILIVGSIIQVVSLSWYERGRHRELRLETLLLG